MHSSSETQSFSSVVIFHTNSYANSKVYIANSRGNNALAREALEPYFDAHIPIKLAPVELVAPNAAMQRVRERERSLGLLAQNPLKYANPLEVHTDLHRQPTVECMFLSFRKSSCIKLQCLSRISQRK